MSQSCFALDGVPAVVVAKPVKAAKGKAAAKPAPVRAAVKSLAGGLLVSFAEFYASIPANGGKAFGAVASMVTAKGYVNKQGTFNLHDKGAKSYGQWLAYYSRLSSRGGAA